MLPNHEDLKIFFWHADNGGSAFYRMQMPSFGLKALEYNDHFGHTNLFFSSAYKATVVGHHVSEDEPSQQWELMKHYVKKRVYDMDDNLFALDKSYADGFAFYNKPNVKENIIKNAGMSDVVTTASLRLKEIMSKFNENTVYIPNGLPAEILNWDVPKAVEGKITIGWAGTVSSKEELKIIAKPVRELLEKRKNYRMHCVGIIPDEIIVAGLGVEEVYATSWVQGTLDYLKAIDFDIWLAPYRNNEFNASKFPTKALEAAFLGIPIIASNIEPYREFIKHGETGFLVKHEYEWARYIRMLAVDEELRIQIGKAARIEATKHTIEGYMPKWLKAYAA